MKNYAIFNTFSVWLLQFGENSHHYIPRYVVDLCTELLIAIDILYKLFWLHRKKHIQHIFIRAHENLFKEISEWVLYQNVRHKQILIFRAKDKRLITIWKKRNKNIRYLPPLLLRLRVTCSPASTPAVRIYIPMYVSSSLLWYIFEITDWNYIILN